ncbi:MAG: adenylate cyclase [Cyclobacteriaceae bacterium]|nr:MAG: adenylate cyclase [Cyclobacteriaceae bacterium]
MIGLAGGFLYTLIEDGWVMIPLFNGTLAGFMVGITIALLELYVFAGNLRKIAFTQIFVLRVGVYFILAFFITFSIFLLSRMIQFDLSFSGVLYSDEFQYYLLNRYYLVLIVCFFVIVLCVFTLQMARKLGHSNLWDFITGKYLIPRKQMRIFMFISLGGIDKIISKTGNLEFHNFINDFIFDITNSVRIHRGKIVHYMEDEVVIVWKVAAGVNQANCIRTYFDLCHEIAGHFEYYHSKYGLLPKPKCAIHAGDAVRAEIGEVKSEISFFGDAVNTTSRILNEAVKSGTDILVSQPVVDMIQIPIHFQTKDQGLFTLKGKHNKIQLYSFHLPGDE